MNGSKIKNQIHLGTAQKANIYWQSNICKNIFDCCGLNIFLNKYMSRMQLYGLNVQQIHMLGKFIFKKKPSQVQTNKPSSAKNYNVFIHTALKSNQELLKQPIHPDPKYAADHSSKSKMR